MEETPRPSSAAYDRERTKIHAQQEALKEKLAELDAKAKAIGPRSNPELDALDKEIEPLKQQAQVFREKNKQILAEIKNSEQNLKRMIAGVQASKKDNPFKSLEDLDARLSAIENSMLTGSLSLVEEKRALDESRKLKNLRRSFEGIKAEEDAIALEKRKLSELRSNFNSEALEKINSLLDAKFEVRNKLRNAIREKSNKMREIQQERDAIYAERRELHEKLVALREERNKQIEEWENSQKEAREARTLEQARKKASEKLKAASTPAYEEEIKEVESLLVYFDPTYTKRGVVDPLSAITANGSNSSLNKATGSTREISIPAGTVIMKKPELNNAVVSKKSKKKGSQKLSLAIDIVCGLSKYEIPIPLGKGDVPKTVELLQAKVDWYFNDRERKTKENIAKAEAELEQLKLEESHE
ncbi:hypothetical protein CANCADRAFT_426 [Tortispora caseinolytica NRRL Y-17796]|uniref:Nuclear segregation protein Bfr1 n=1 Tax=Tortispora caseinolytica NRRL Y-17796 TaxID=767744 RepID=A0A1E4TJA6_9ASCO|nr:hypothetical protein CANCADRAFT_426 [Tortispora caseinolytica NRRL Y-17796]